ncbi:unnamed protein product [Effrenium voratum]|uniref:Uncharacterized protein n=1 Tax=Effrenium voratum TaxID=2562239 RepID=A0AA36HUA6_9DINO|nr:unnamed protein product [Effrenium voratum]CAJ1375488.1 unnamed protein product [Effrenium voratum]CAJ1461277.1 unnamed protein product [Effrenium voratum]
MFGTRLVVLLVTLGCGLAADGALGDTALTQDDECQTSDASQCSANFLQVQKAPEEVEELNLSSSYHYTHIVTLYHQTSESAGKSILKSGFRPGHLGWCGAGIYFALSPQATSGKIKGPDSHAGYMIEAKVNVGKSKRMSWHCTTSASCNHHPFAKCQDRENRGSWLKRQGYDSIYYQPDPYGPEYVIYNPDLVVSMKGYRYHR